VTCQHRQLIFILNCSWISFNISVSSCDFNIMQSFGICECTSVCLSHLWTVLKSYKLVVAASVSMTGSSCGVVSCLHPCSVIWCHDGQKFKTFDDFESVSRHINNTESRYLASHSVRLWSSIRKYVKSSHHSI